MRRIIVAASLLALLGWTGCERSPDQQPGEPEPATGEEETNLDAERADAGEQPETGAGVDPQGDATADDADDGLTVRVREHDEVGSYLVDGEGLSLYLFEADSKGTSACYEDCAEAWPPLTTETAPTAGEGVDELELDTIERRDGQKQVTYGGHPLYYFTNDQEPGDINGQEIEGFGGEWYLVSPDAERVTGEGHREGGEE